MVENDRQEYAQLAACTVILVMTDIQYIDRINQINSIGWLWRLTTVHRSCSLA